MMPINLEALDIEITTKCNLACSYCYIGMAKLKNEKNFGGMTNELIEDIFTLIERHGYKTAVDVTYPDGRKVRKGPTHISFYGGEPIVDFERVKYFVEKSKEKGMKLQFSLLSNGMVGNPAILKYLRENNIYVQRSIDGCPEVQEKDRPGSIKPYLAMTKLFKDYAQTRRMTVQPQFAKLLMKSLQWFEEQGFTGGISPMANYYTEWSEQQIKEFMDSLWELGRYYVQNWQKGKPFYMYYFSREMALRFMQPEKGGQFGCGGANGLHCISWDGWLYMCHRFSKEAHDSQFCFGSVKQILAGEAKGYGEKLCSRVADFSKGKAAWNEECKTCVAQYGCEKGCIHTNYLCTKTLHKQPRLYCLIRQESAKIVTWIDSQLRTKNPNWWTHGNSIKGVREYAQRMNRCNIDQVQPNCSGCKGHSHDKQGRVSPEIKTK